MRPEIENLPASKIRDVANAALGRADVLAFWFGESDEVTPEPIRQAAAESLARGETFYAHNLGLPSLREAVAGYVSALHGPVSVDRIAITASGVTALMLAFQALIGAGDEVVAVTPVWPNLTAQPVVLGAQVRRLPLQPQRDGSWRLDLDALMAAVTPKTRVLLINAPNNPTGWTLTRDEQRAILAHCRKTGTWILSDEVYERLFYADGGVAPSFLDVADASDRVVVAQSFSKSFLMTGWRLGWLVMPDGMSEHMGKLIEFASSCSPVFVQRAAEVALAHADRLVPPLRQHLLACRDRLIGGLQALPGVTASSPPGGMYAFFRIEGQNDSMALAQRLVAEHGLGLAPGVAFGPEGEGWLRWCFASRDLSRLEVGLDRLRQAVLPG